MFAKDHSKSYLSTLACVEDTAYPQDAASMTLIEITPESDVIRYSSFVNSNMFHCLSNFGDVL